MPSRVGRGGAAHRTPGPHPLEPTAFPTYPPALEPQPPVGQDTGGQLWSGPALYHRRLARDAAAVARPRARPRARPGPQNTDQLHSDGDQHRSAAGRMGGHGQPELTSVATDYRAGYTPCCWEHRYVTVYLNSTSQVSKLEL